MIMTSYTDVKVEFPVSAQAVSGLWPAAGKLTLLASLLVVSGSASAGLDLVREGLKRRKPVS